MIDQNASERPENGGCGLEYAEVDVHVAAAEGLYELLGGRT